VFWNVQGWIWWCTLPAFQRRPECAVLEAALDTKVTFCAHSVLETFDQSHFALRGFCYCIVAEMLYTVEFWLIMKRVSHFNVFSVTLLVQTPYIDVCDDQDYSVRAKSYHDKAVAAQVPAITTAGIYPGVSNSGSFQRTDESFPLVICHTLLMCCVEVVEMNKM
jgi:hypothetical protein